MSQSWTFDSDYDGWSDNGTTGTSWVASPYHEASGAIKFIADPGASLVGIYIDGPFFGTKVSAWVRSIPISPNPSTVYVQISAWDAGFSTLYSIQYNFDQSEADSGWVYLETEPIPADFSIAQIEIFCHSDATGNARFYVDDVLLSGGATFYFGQGPGEGVLTQKFGLPFGGVNPGAMTLNQSLGTVVIGADNPATEAVVYSNYPYPTGTAMSQGHTTGTSISSLKWI